jgi:DNA-binding transcriptional ArsR family regulator
MNKNHKRLQFPCECVSARGGYSDPWAAVAQNKLLPNGTKEEILNLVAEEPRTIAQIAKVLNLSQPSVHKHINEMMTSELLRESKEWERKYPMERYYEPNFPVLKVGEQEEFEQLCQEMAKDVAALFESQYAQLESAFNQTDLSNGGWAFSDITHYLYAQVQRGAREILEQRGLLPPRTVHRNGAEWIFWAEESKTDDEK